MEVQVRQSGPQYLLIRDAIPRELCQVLIDFVEDQPSVADWSDGTSNLIERRLDYRPGYEISKDTTLWKKKKIRPVRHFESQDVALAGYLHKAIFPLIDVVTRLICPNTAGLFCHSYEKFWVRRYAPGGKFEPHFDWNTTSDGREYNTPDLASLSVALNDDYQGGEVMVSCGHTPEGKLEFSEVKGMVPGTGVMWDGWTHHAIRPVVSGFRFVLVVHFQGILKS